MDYNFVRLSEVPESDQLSDAGHVLAEDNGAICRVPKANLAGGTRGMVVNADYDNGVEVAGSLYRVVSGDYDAVLEHLTAGGALWVRADNLYSTVTEADNTLYAAVTVWELVDNVLMLSVPGLTFATRPWALPKDTSRIVQYVD